MKTQKNSSSKANKKITSLTVFGNVSKQTKFSLPKKPKNIDRRSREHLSPKEIDAIIKAAKQGGRHGYRDAAMILIAYRHGLRISELISLRFLLLEKCWPVLEIKQNLACQYIRIC